MNKIKSGMYDINGIEICVGQKVYAPYVDHIFCSVWEDTTPHKDEICEVVLIEGCICVKYEGKINTPLNAFDTSKMIEVANENLINKIENIYECEICGFQSDDNDAIDMCRKKCEIRRHTYKIKEFEITENHLKLFNRQNVSFNHYTEFGATEINPKRPYGNGDVSSDIGDILGISPEGEVFDEEDNGIYFTTEQELYFWKLHCEMMLVLQIFCNTMEIKTGKYEKIRFSEWIEIK